MTPVLTYFSCSGLICQLSMTDPGLLNLQPKNLGILILGIKCVNLTGTISNFSCSLPSNADGSVKLPAGKLSPKIFVT